MNLNDVLVKPIVTEKSTEVSDLGKYVFKVATNANKNMVKNAVKSIFGVEPETVNVINVRSKKKRTKYKIGFKPGWKKAIITLKKGDKIDLFDNQ